MLALQKIPETKTGKEDELKGGKAILTLRWRTLSDQ